MTSKILKDKLKERFSRYVRIWTTSDSAAADNGMIPSTSGQMNFAKMLGIRALRFRAGVVTGPYGATEELGKLSPFICHPEQAEGASKDPFL